MEVKIGQSVSIHSSFGPKRGYVVTKISPTGQVTAERAGEKRRFLPNGYEIGSFTFYGRARLVIDKKEEPK